MMKSNGFNEPIIEDPNTSVGAYPWDGDFGATHSYDTMSMAVMSNPVESFVEPAKDAVSEEFEGLKEEVTESAPEGADMGQPLDAGGDADGQNFGQDQGSEDTMEVESVNLPVVGTVSVLTLAIVGIGGYWLWSRRN